MSRNASNHMADRMLALAGLVQALAQVRRIAEHGQSDPSAAKAVVDSVFRIDAPSAEAVYGQASALAPGLRVLRDYFDKQAQGRNEALLRLTLSVLQLERRFSGQPDMVEAVGNGIARIAPRAEADSAHPDVLNALGGLYAETLSQLRPKVMVQGNPHYLAQPAVVAEIRALLLAAVRSAVLWRQLGGSYWDFLFSRKAMRETVEGWLRG